jgi:thiol-disulfide isomerase/thioredoxin
MSTLRYALIPVFFFAAACDIDGDGLKGSEERDLGTDPRVADSDGDGLLDGEEAELGADPLTADTDGDGLLDGDERDLGTDPADPDSDGDGYTDYSEFLAETDALDADDVIYTGGWPFQPYKESVAEDMIQPGNLWRVGRRITRIRTRDQYNERVDIYDYSLQGKLTIVDSSALWCGPCRDTASWLSTGNGSQEGPYGAVRRAVNRGDLQWVTVIAQNNYGNVPSIAELQAWDQQYPHDKVAVLKDTADRTVYFGVNIDGNYEIFPQAVLLDEEMHVLARGGMNQVLAAARDAL